MNARRQFRSAAHATLVGLHMVRMHTETKTVPLSPSVATAGAADEDNDIDYTEWTEGMKVKIVKKGSQTGNTAVIVGEYCEMSSTSLIKVKMNGTGEVKSYTCTEMVPVDDEGAAASGTGKRKRSSKRALQSQSQSKAAKKKKKGANTKFKAELHRKELAELREVFDIYDSNNDGELDRSEIRFMLENLGTAESASNVKALVNDMMERFDKNGDGKISFEEFAPVLADAKKRHGKAELMEAFRAFDKDGDECISQHEIKLMAEAMGVHLTDAELESMLMGVDTNGDGVINFTEFIELVLPSSTNEEGQ
jgi:Ca2+-binding EF-hand superfamily protein